MTGFVYNPVTRVLHRYDCTQGPLRENSNPLEYPDFPADMVLAVRPDRLCSFCKPQTSWLRVVA